MKTRRNIDGLKFIKKLYSFRTGRYKIIINYFSKTLDLKLSERLIFGANKERKNHLRIRKGMVNGMKKKDFMIKVTEIDLLVVCISLIALLLIPALQSLLYYKILVYGVLCINMVVDLSVLVLNKLKKNGNVLKNMVIGFLITKLLVLFMASLYCIIMILAK